MIASCKEKAGETTVLRSRKMICLLVTSVNITLSFNAMCLSRIHHGDCAPADTAHVWIPGYSIFTDVLKSRSLNIWDIFKESLFVWLFLPKNDSQGLGDSSVDTCICSLGSSSTSPSSSSQGWEGWGHRVCWVRAHVQRCKWAMVPLWPLQSLAKRHETSRHLSCRSRWQCPATSTICFSSNWSQAAS